MVLEKRNAGRTPRSQGGARLEHVMDKAVLLDRDGTVVVDKEYGSDPGVLELVPGGCEALKTLSESGYALVIVSNQGGAGMGLFTESDVLAFDGRLREMLAACGVQLAGSYYCLHDPESGCGCRKPETALALRAARELDLDLRRSWIIGDKTSDVMLAKNIGSRSVLVLTGKGSRDGRFEVEPDYTAADLLEAARIIRRADS